MYYDSPCSVRTKTVLADLKTTDFSVVVSITASRSNDADLEVVLKKSPNFGDIKEITSVGDVHLYDDKNDTVAIDTVTGPTTTGAPTQIELPFPAVAITTGNTGNLWKVVFEDVEVETKDGQTFTMPSLTLTFVSPF